MHTERYRVPESTMQACRAGRARGRRRHDGGAGTRVGRRTRRAGGRTNIFIHRGFDWQVVDVLMTNFHLPKTTLLMMIDAFVGDRWRRLYADALAGDYRFLSFGDAMLLDGRLADVPGDEHRRHRRRRRVGPRRHGDDRPRHVHDAAVHAGRAPAARSST